MFSAGRKKTISQEEAKTAFARHEVRQTTGMSGSTGSVTYYHVEVWLESGRTLEILNAGGSERRAQEMADKIRKFAEE